MEYLACGTCRVESATCGSRKVEYGICGTCPVEYATCGTCCSSTKLTRSSWSFGKIETVLPGTKHSSELMIAKCWKSLSEKGGERRLQYALC